MQVLVETYEQTEVGCNGVESSVEQLALMEELGLEGQLEVQSPDGLTINPYRQMTQEEWLVYRNVCPSVTAVKLYKGDSIPLRCLQVLSHCKQADLFKYYYIMHKELAVIKDPILIGCGEEYNTWWDAPRMPKNTFILARWGTELESFEKLKQMACQIAEKRLELQMKAIINKAKVFIEAMKDGSVDVLKTDISSLDRYMQELR